MALPECFGVFWEGIASTPLCNEQCGAKQECLAKFATETLVKYQRELGDRATVHHLAELTSVKPEAILLAIDYQNSMVVAQAPAPIRAPVVSSSPVPVGGVIPVPMPPPVDSAQGGVPVPPSVPGAACDPSEGISHLDGLEEVPVAKKPPRKKKAPGKGTNAKVPATEKQPGTKAPKKKAPPKKAVPVNPREAGAALRAAAPAEAAKEEFAIPAGGPDFPKRWSQEHDVARFHRERDRSPLISRLPEGYVLQRRWPYQKGLGPIHRVVVGKRSYRYQGTEYPTLYAVVQAIAGVKGYGKQLRIPGKEDSRPEGVKLSTSWSVAKFFGLAKEILSLEDERAGKGKCRPPKWKRHPKQKKKPPKRGGL